MDDLATNLDALKLAERLHGARRDDFWVHLEAGSPLEKYPAKQHARRVRERLDVLEGLIYLPGAPSRNYEDNDMPAPFRQRRYFYYLSGCNEANCQLAYDLKRDILTLFIPRINPNRVVWNGRGSTPTEAMDKYDIDEVFYTDQVESWIHDWFLHYRHDQALYILHKEQIPPLRFPWPIDCDSLQPAIDQCRMVKDEHEINLIRKANEISSRAHEQVLANITKFHNEAQVQGQFLNVCVSNQAKEQAYDIIAASGPNAGTLHYDANNEEFGDRQLMCLDAGCEYQLYASDITRTFPLSGSWPSKEAEDIYKLVERMQEACIQRLAPGVRYLDLHVLAHQIAIDGLLKLGLLHNGTREEIYKAGTSKAFFPHGLGHHVGLDVHDVGQRELMSFYQHNQYNKVPSLYPENFHLPIYDQKLCMAPTDAQSPHLEEGNVVTVEPGIYFSAYAFKHFYLPSPVHSRYINVEVLQRYFPVGGVRIEDDVLITSKGYENLTTAAKGDAMFDIIKGQATRSSPKLRENKKVDVLEEPLCRAPGIPKRVAEPMLKQISRAATEPLPGTRRTSAEIQAFQDHWLFRDVHEPTRPSSHARRDRTQHVGDASAAATQEIRVPLCGSPRAGVGHIFMSWQNDCSRIATSPHRGSDIKEGVQKCKHCVVLSETVDRLRKTLNQSAKASSSPSLRLGNADLAYLDKIQASTTTEKRTVHPPQPQIPEMRQVSSVQVKDSSITTPGELSARGSNLPPFPISTGHRLSGNIRSEIDYSSTCLPQAKTPRRSVTFDSQAIRHPEPLEREKRAIPNTEGSRHVPHACIKPKNQAECNYSKAYMTSCHFPPSGPVFPQALTESQDPVLLPNHLPTTSLPALQETRPSVTPEQKILPTLIGRRSLSEAHESDNAREQYRNPPTCLRHPDPRPSLPNLRSNPFSTGARREQVAPIRSQASGAQSHHPSSIPTNVEMRENDLTRRRSMINALRSSASASNSNPAPAERRPPPKEQVPNYSGNPYVSASGSSRSPSWWLGNQQPSERANTALHGGPLRTSYAGARHGGEELPGVDYTYY